MGETYKDNIFFSRGVLGSSKTQEISFDSKGYKKLIFEKAS